MSYTAEKLDLMRQRLFIPVTEFQGLVGAAGVGTGVPVHEEMATLLPGIGALALAATNDDIAHLMLVPSDWDRHNKIYVRGVWSTQSTTTSDTMTLLFNYLAITPETTAIAVPATALDTAIAADNPVGTANVLQRTSAGVINPKGIADAALYLAFKFTATLSAGLAEKVYFHGVEFEYTPKLSRNFARRKLEGDAWEA